MRLHTGVDESSGVRSLLADVCLLSEQLNRPLICRILPVPGKTENDEVDFEANKSNPYILNCSKLSYFLEDSSRIAAAMHSS